MLRKPVLEFRIYFEALVTPLGENVFTSVKRLQLTRLFQGAFWELM